MRGFVNWTPSAIAVTFVLALSGCNQGPEDRVPAPNQTSEAVTEAPRTPKVERKKEGMRGKRGFRHGPGPVHLMRAALELKDLTPEQKVAIEKISDGLEKSGDEKPDGGLDKALATAVRSGNFDDPALAKAVDEIEKAAEARKTKMHGALNELHRTLTTDQRQALVTELERKAEERGKHRGPKGPPAMGDEQGAGDPETEGADAPEAADPSDEPRRRGHGMRGPGKGRGFGHGGFGMLRELNLSEEQQKKLREARDQGEKPEGMRRADKGDFQARHKAMLSAFAKADFDAARASPGADHEKPMRKMLEQRIAHVKMVYGVLDAEQRAKYATLLEQGKKRGRSR